MGSGAHRAVVARLLELFEGPEAPGPWAPPAAPAMLHALLPWRAFDESSELYVNAGSVGFVIDASQFVMTGRSRSPYRRMYFQRWVRTARWGS